MTFLHKRCVLAEDFDPPAPWATFDIRVRGGQHHGSTMLRRQSIVSRLTDEELAWVARTVAAELLRRQLNTNPSETRP